MNKFLMVFCTIFCAGITVTAQACTTNEIDVFNDGTQCETAKFTITTTELTANTEFKFYMSAQGTFYVDYGDGTVDTITRTNTTETLYDHTYTTAGVKTIRFGGLATGYNTGGTAAIRFGYGSATETDDATPRLIESISGSLGAIFSTLGQTSGTQPSFIWSFATATSISHIPENLFAGVTGGRRSMFSHTFYRCYALEDIPEHLFANITAASWMFQATFAGCVRLTSIPETLFENITFCETGMFYSTFADCKQVTKIPERLFANITSVPGTSQGFYGTFTGCSALSGYIPPSTFAGLIANGSPVAGNMWGDAFYGTKLATSCPSRKMPYFTGYESYWAGKVSCQDIVPVTCDAGEYFSATDARCHVCTNDNYCPGGTYTYDGTNMGLIACPAGTFAPAGMWEAAQCGRILHVGDGFVYLRATKKTSPSLHLDLDHDGVADYFGNMTTLDVPMSSGTQRKLKVRYNNTTYSIYDDSVEIPTE